VCLRRANCCSWSIFKYAHLQDDGRFAVEIRVKTGQLCCVCEAQKIVHIVVLSGELTIGGSY